MRFKTIVNRSSIALSIVFAASLAGAQTKRPMTLMDLFAVPHVADPQLAIDGRQVYFTMDKPDWTANRRVSHIWRISVDGTGLMQLTYGEHGETSPRRSPDGAKIAFLTRRGGSELTQIFLLNAQGGEATPLSRHSTAVSSISWSSDGQSIYFLASEPKSEEEKNRDQLKDDVFAFDENYKQEHLWRISVQDGTEHRLTQGDFSVRSYKLSRNGRQIAFHRAPTSLLGDDYLAEVWVMDADGSNAVQLTRNSVSENGAELSPDNSQVLYVAGSHQDVQRDDGNVFVVSARGGTPRVLIPDFPYDVDAATWSADGRTIFMVVNMGVHSELFEVDAAGGKPRQLTDGPHAIQGWSFAPGLNRHVFQFDEPTRAGEIWIFGADRAPSRVTNIYEYLDHDFKLPKQERIQWKGADGVTIEGLLYYPVDYEAGKRYPLCVQTHEGRIPRTSSDLEAPAPMFQSSPHGVTPS